MKKYTYQPTPEDFALLHHLQTMIEALPDECVSYTDLGPILPNGCDILGNGSFGYAISHPTNARLCIKIGFGDNHRKRDHWKDPWMGFAAYCIRRPSNKYLPGIYALFVGPSFYLALMERLEEDRYGELAYRRRRYMKSVGDSMTMQYAPDDYKGKPVVSHPVFLKWQAMFKAIRKLAPSARIDLHNGNILFRGDTPVILDPLAFYYSKKEAVKALAPVANGKTVVVRQRCLPVSRERTYKVDGPMSATKMSSTPERPHFSDTRDFPTYKEATRA